MQQTRRRLGRWLVWAIALAVLYEILEDAPVKSELIAGAIAAAAAGAVAVWLSVTCSTRYAPSWSDLRHLYRVPRDVLRDTFIVAGAILRSIREPDVLKGTVEVLPFEFGGEKDPQEALRRAIVTIGISLAPNTVVCMMEKNQIAIHRLCGLTPPQQRRDTRWPI